MKEIKTKLRTRSIKKLDRASNLIVRAKTVSLRSKHRHAERSEPDPTAPVEYAQAKMGIAVKITLGNGKHISTAVAKRMVRLMKKNRNLSTEADSEKRRPQNQAGMPIANHRKTVRHSATVPPRTARPLQLQKPIDGKYSLPSGAFTGRKGFIHSRVNARLSYRRQPLEQQRQAWGRNIAQTPSGKHPSTTSVASSHVRAGARTPNKLVKDKETQPWLHRSPQKSMNSSLRPSRHNQVKMSRKLIKTLSHSIKETSRAGRGGSQSNVPSEKRGNSSEAQRAAYRLMSARKSIQRMQAIARFNIRVIRMVLKAVTLAVKGMMALLGVSSTVILLMCIILAAASVIASPFGIFVSDENTDNDILPLAHIVQELDAELNARLEDIQQAAGSVDRVETHYTGSADNTHIDNWFDIIAVFAVKTAMDSENGMDVATLDVTRMDVIHSVFWEMNQLESFVETIEHTETITVEDEDGETIEDTVTRVESVLHMTILSKTAEQQAHLYGFTDEQKTLMEEMLSEEFRPFMFALLDKDAGAD